MVSRVFDCGTGNRHHICEINIFIPAKCSRDSRRHRCVSDGKCLYLVPVKNVIGSESRRNIYSIADRYRCLNGIILFCRWRDQSFYLYVFITPGNWCCVVKSTLGLAAGGDQYSGVFLSYVVVPRSHALHSDQSFDLHVLGMWISFLISAAVMAYFVMKMRAALFAKDNLLAAAREQAIRDEKLVSLGALAASTAHEMGTPLGTMQLIVSELQENNISRQDIDVLLEQVQRCKNALSEMSTSAGGVPLEGGELVDIREYLHTLIEDWRSSRPNVMLTADIQEGLHKSVIAEKALSKALVNLLDNAADASPRAVHISAQWDEQQVNIVVSDNGKGVSPQVLNEIGKKPYSNKPDGIGIGAFLSHEIIRRLGGMVKLNNRASGGLETVVTLPLQL